MPWILTDSRCGTLDQTTDEARFGAGASNARVRIVLVGTSHPGNIGATARAMKVMGLTELHLVAPERFPDEAATARAVGADDVLTAARVHATLAAALSGVDVIYGTSARGRRIAWPTVSPRIAAAEIAALGDTRVALVFGPERTGLSNSSLDLCQRLIEIPTVREFSSLNLAQAVQICAYELFLQTPAAPLAPRGRRRLSEQAASVEEVADLQRHCLRVMEAVGFHDPVKPKLLERRLRRLLGRAALLDSEVQILRGFLAAVEEELK